MRWGARRNSRARPSERRSPRLENDERVQFVEDHAPERAEQIGRVGRGKQKRKLLGRRQQNLRRIAALTLTLRGRGVAGPGLDADRQPHFRDRRFQIARDVDCERLERRNVKRMQPALALQVAAARDQLALAGRACRRGAAEFDEARQKSGERLAAAGRRDQQHGTAGMRLRQKFELMRARNPAASGEPAREYVRQHRGALEHGHGLEVATACGGVETPATTTRLSTGTPFSLRTATAAIDVGARPAAASERRMYGSAWA